MRLACGILRYELFYILTLVNGVRVVQRRRNLLQQGLHLGAVELGVLGGDLEDRVGRSLSRLGVVEILRRQHHALIGLRRRQRAQGHVLVLRLGIHLKRLAVVHVLDLCIERLRRLRQLDITLQSILAQIGILRCDLIQIRYHGIVGNHHHTGKRRAVLLGCIVALDQHRDHLLGTGGGQNGIVQFGLAAGLLHAGLDHGYLLGGRLVDNGLIDGGIVALAALVKGADGIEILLRNHIGYQFGNIFARLGHGQHGIGSLGDTARIEYSQSNVLGYATLAQHLNDTLVHTAVERLKGILDNIHLGHECPHGSLIATICGLLQALGLGHDSGKGLLAADLAGSSHGRSHNLGIRVIHGGSHSVDLRGGVSRTQPV